MYTREEYENLINNSPLFEIDEASAPMLYQAERYNFLTRLTDYYRFYIYSNKPLDFYSMTLIITANECIKYYNRGKGQFLHLFNTAMKRELHIAKAIEIIEEKRQGIKISKEDDKLIRKVIMFAKSKNLDIYDSATQEKISNALNIDIAKLKEIIIINDNAVGVPSTIINEDGDEIELFDLQPSKEKNAEEKIVERDSLNDRLKDIEAEYLDAQDRQKKILSMLLTTEIIKSQGLDLIKTNRFVFFNKDILDYFEINQKLPTAKIIGELCGVSEQSISRTYKNFKIKLKQRIVKYRNI